MRGEIKQAHTWNNCQRYKSGTTIQISYKWHIENCKTEIGRTVTHSSRKKLQRRTAITSFSSEVKISCESEIPDRFLFIIIWYIYYTITCYLQRKKEKHRRATNNFSDYITRQVYRQVIKNERNQIKRNGLTVLPYQFSPTALPRFRVHNQIKILYALKIFRMSCQPEYYNWKKVAISISSILRKF